MEARFTNGLYGTNRGIVGDRLRALDDGGEGSGVDFVLLSFL